MSTLLAAAEVRAAQATTAREAAEQVLAEALQAVGIVVPWYATAGDMIQWRIVEARLEHPDCPQDLARAYGRLCRTRNAERKAKSAANRARWAEHQTTGSVARADDLDAAEVYRRLLELRAA